MNSIKDQKLYDKCKLIVKSWENNFYKENKRLPSKHDIREAAKNIRDAYRTYFKLKTAALEESFSDVFDFENDHDISNTLTSEQEVLSTSDIVNENIPIETKDCADDVWGKHLNISQAQTDSIKSSTKENVNSSFTKKLFANSKFVKRNPRKSIKINTAKKEPEPIVPIEVPVETNIEVPLEENNCKFKSLPIATKSLQVSTQPINVINQMINNSDGLPFRKVDLGWLDRVSAATSGVECEVQQTDEASNEFDDDDVIVSDSDEDSYNPAKRRKISSPQNENLKSFIDSSIQININPVTSSQNSSIAELPQELTNNSLNISTDNVIPDACTIKNTADDIKNDELDTEPVQVTEKSKSVSDEDEWKPEIKRKRSSRITKTARSPKEVPAKKTRGRPKVPKPPTNPEGYEMEYSIKPPPRTVPRFKELLNEVTTELPETIEVPIKTNSKLAAAEQKLKKKIESGTLNDNFIRLDMKKKLFVRGKKTMNFSRYKKQLWKNKKKSLCGPDMDMSGCDGGVLTCFQCGKTGHFARQCKAQPIDKLLPLEAAEEECPFPTLEEASKQARESVLSVHVPSLIPPDNNTQTTEESDDVYEFDDDEDLENYMLNTEEFIDSDSCGGSQPPRFQENDKCTMPIYKLNCDNSVIETPNEVLKALKLFGHSSFRPGQELAVMRILSGLSTLVTLSTGSGKSLCYQLPAYLYAQKYNCVSLIISPLVSLMDDQVSGMPTFLKAACLHTGQTSVQREKVLALIESGDLNILLVSPEAVTAGEKSSGFGSFMKKLPGIAFACIDEAHCVSQWSHNFRPSYLMICKVLREKLGIKTILGLTATSTYATSTNIIEHLKIPDGQNGVISDIPLPDNLFLNVSCDRIRDTALGNLLTSKPYTDYNSIIIYCTRREECERIASYLRTSLRSEPTEVVGKKYKSINRQAEPYHAGLPASKRRTVQNAFMSGYLRIVVATVAFGMGINKADIRAVIHYNMPKNFESYIQEVGRAGRDGLTAHCHLFLDSEGRDQCELKRHIYANSMDRHVIRKLLQKIFISCGCKNVCPRHEVAFSVESTVQALDIPEENISTLLCYLELNEKKYIEVLTPAYTVCKVISYGSRQEILKAARECSPLAVALALQKNDKGSKKDDNIFEFPVVDVAASIGWDSGICKHTLKNLEWTQENGQPKRSNLSIQFSNLGFRLRAPGNLSDTELDDLLDNLFAKVKHQETSSLLQLQIVHSTLTAAAEPSFRQCLSDKYLKKSAELKASVRQYFSSETPLLSMEAVEQTVHNEDQIVNDTRSLIAMYRDNTFTGRAVARIFHGIQSPNYPAVIWGKCKFWRAHMFSDFNRICQIATTEILKYR